MSASQYRGQLDRKRKQRIDADKKAGEYRSKESSKRADAAKARQAAAQHQQGDGEYCDQQDQQRDCAAPEPLQHGHPPGAAVAARKQLHEKTSLVRRQALGQDRTVTFLRANNNRLNTSPPRAGV